MYWTIRFKVNKLAHSPTSTIRIDAENLREACLDILGIYRNAAILSYQEDGGEVRPFNLADIEFQTYPVDPMMFSIAKE